MQGELSPTAPGVSPDSPGDRPGAPPRRDGGQRSPSPVGPSSVRFGLVAIAASLVAHVAIMELIGSVDSPSPKSRPTPTRIAIVRAPVIAIEPIGIELVAPTTPRCRCPDGPVHTS